MRPFLHRVSKSNSTLDLSRVLSDFYPPWPYAQWQPIEGSDDETKTMIQYFKKAIFVLVSDIQCHPLIDKNLATRNNTK